MDWKEISEEEAKNHPDYGFGGGLFAVYAICVVWSLHSLRIVDPQPLVSPFGSD